MLLRLRSPAPLVACGFLATVFLGVAMDGAAAQEPLPRVPPTEPAQALDTFVLQDGFRLELLAAEPLVNDPVAMVYDEDGRAFVAEMRDYPYVGKEHDQAWSVQTSPGIGRISLLADEDGDGRFDSSTVFAEGLSWPTGLAFWKGGLFVTATPDIWYLKDTDGDGRADLRQKVFTGFRKYNVQAVINNLQWGLDHRLYAAGSSNGGEITVEDSLTGRAAGGPAIRLGRSDFRFNPVDESFEAISGGARFGNSFDNWGERFISNIRNPVQHIVLEDRYLKRNPGLAIGSAVHDAAEAGDAVPVFRISPPEPWRVLNADRLAAANRAGTPRSEMHAVGFVTSASGATVYRGTAYPEQYRGNIFVGEVAGNLVMRYVLKPDGATFSAQRVGEGIEFLASRDNWFRPVNFVNAPDGTLHMLDMYRETIEHPWSIPDDIKARVDLESGRDRGRIYRLVPPGETTRPATPRPRLSQASAAELVALLEHPDGWWRETAHRLLHERQDPDAIEPLTRLVEASVSPLARLHALYALEGLQRLSDDVLRHALTDESPRVREHAIRLAEPRLSQSPELIPLIQESAAHADARVRMQVLLTAAEFPAKQRNALLEKAARRDVGDPWMMTALLCSLPPEEAAAVLTRLLGNISDEGLSEAKPLTSPLIALVAARKQPAELAAVATSLIRWIQPSQGDVPFDSSACRLLVDLAERLRRSAANLADAAVDETLATELEALFALARTAAADVEQPIERRAAAIRLAACDRFERSQPLLALLLDVRQPQEVQLAAVDALGSCVDSSIGETFLTRYKLLTPPVRERIVTHLLSRAERVDALLNAVEQKIVPAGDIPEVRRTLLLKSGSAEVKSRATALFATSSVGPRSEAIARYRPALEAPGDVVRGQAVFRRECANCHRLGEEGFDVGPNLATVRHRTPEELLTHILDPNREVSPNFIEYAVATTDGLVKTGIIASETPTNLVLKQAQGKQESVLRQEIDTLTGSGKSLMPEGLELKLTPAEMADLIALIRGVAP